MKLQQLIEGQKEQILNLSPNTPVTLYYATSISDAAMVLLQHSTNDYNPVFPSLKTAMPHGPVVLQFYGLGRHLEAPRTPYNVPEEDWAYIDSDKPEDLWA